MWKSHHSQSLTSKYAPKSLHYILCGIMRHSPQNCGMPDIDLLKDPEFADLKSSLDAEMKKIQAFGKGSIKKQAEPLSLEEEELFWEKKLLGDHNPETLLNTIVFMNGFYFALRSGNEHRDLRHNPCQNQLFEPLCERAFLRYTEDTSKNRPEGLKGRKIKPKVVVHYSNPGNPHLLSFSRSTTICVLKTAQVMPFISLHWPNQKNTAGFPRQL